MLRPRSGPTGGSDALREFKSKLKFVQWRRLQTNAYTPVLQVRLERCFDGDKPLKLRCPSANELTTQLLHRCIEVLTPLSLPSEVSHVYRAPTPHAPRRATPTIRPLPSAHPTRHLALSP